MRKRTWLIGLAVILSTTFSLAQDACGPTIENARKSPDAVKKLRATLDFNLTPACVVEMLLLRKDAHTLNAVLVAAYKNATQDLQQNGSSSGSGGSTNLVSKGLSSRVLSFASEYGAVTETTSGQTSTISGTLNGIPLALEAHTNDLIAECPLNLLGNQCLRSSWLDVLGRLSYSVALNTTQAAQLKGTATGPVQGTAQPTSVQSSGSAGTVSQITGKFVIVQPAVKLTALTKALRSLDANSALQKDADALASAAKTLRGYQENAGETAGGAWDLWAAATAQQLSTVPVESVVSEWRKQGDSLAKVLENGGSQKGRPTDEQLTQAALTYAATFAALGSAERSFYESGQLSSPVLSFEYDENRPTSQPSNSVFRLIYSQKPGGWTLTGNAAVSIYDSRPSSSIPGAQKLRDIQLAFEGDHNLPKWGILGTPTFSAAYYFQDQTSPAILNVMPSGPVSGVTFAGLASNATQVFAEKGKISIGQVRIALGSSKSGLRFPIAITGSNRTELITKSKLGGQVGISYDFDSLFSK
jgi:hypothetical protein